jgi:hypothetical protein
MSTQQWICRAAKVSVAATAIVCAVVCCVAFSIAGTADEFEEVESPQIIVETVVMIDTSALPEHPTEEDWYTIAVQVLDDKGWDLSPNLTMVSGLFACQPDTVLDELDLDFADAYFNGIIPYLKTASVSLDRTTNTASVSIAHQALRWRHSTLDLSEMQFGLHEAIRIADRHGGQKFRELVNGRCEMSVLISDYEWIVSYKESGQLIWSDLRILVDSRSGKARQVPR